MPASRRRPRQKPASRSCASARHARSATSASPGREPARHAHRGRQPVHGHGPRRPRGRSPAGSTSAHSTRPSARSSSRASAWSSERGERRARVVRRREHRADCRTARAQVQTAPEAPGSGGSIRAFEDRTKSRLPLTLSRAVGRARRALCRCSSLPLAAAERPLRVDDLFALKDVARSAAQPGRPLGRLHGDDASTPRRTAPTATSTWRRSRAASRCV